ncbi:hypothetical protein CapIbe_021964 [Capra ibex]
MDDASEQSQFLKNLGQKQQIIGVAETFARRRPTLSLDSTKSLHAWILRGLDEMLHDKPSEEQLADSTCSG